MASEGVAPAGAVGTADAPTLLGGKLLFWCVWPPLVVADLWSKSAVFAFLAERFPAMPPHARYYGVYESRISFGLVSWNNPGTIWGLFQNATAVLIVLRCVAIVALLWFVRGTPRRQRLQVLVLGLIFAGAVGNLWDNFTCAQGGVRDFLRFSGTWPVSWEFPAFNVADSCITVGAISLLLLLLGQDRRSSRTAEAVS